MTSHCGKYRVSTATVLALVLGWTAGTSLGAESEAIAHIRQDGRIRLAMYLGFEGLSFQHGGKRLGLEVELANLLCEEISIDLGKEVKPEIVNQEWSQLVQTLRDRKCHAVFSALVPSTLYSRHKVSYTRSYLDTGPVICCQEVDGKPAKDVGEHVASLAMKRIVVINGPAVRAVLRGAGIYVPHDQDKTNLERAFPKSATEAALLKAGKSVPLVPVREIIQLDEMPAIYSMIASGAVDAGVIDKASIWWVSSESRRWARKIHAFPTPVGPYIYSVMTRKEDADLSALFEKAVTRMLQNPKYAEVCRRWHGGQVFSWGLSPADLLR
ncbi:MAG TPA: transporter substrate-binding domain-containing protein [Planctomycetota bacterium]|nr:transporter substrate-binding domain-containing protein [Planctomycetota bacterium]